MNHRTMLALLGLAMAPHGYAADVGNTRMLSAPVVHGQNLAFVYDNDVWLTSLSGGGARRLTHAPGEESALRFSPDGQWLAFSANYGDNTDVYVMPARGGEVRRLTWHPGEDVVAAFTPEGRVLFHSERGRLAPQSTHLYSIAVSGGVPERIAVSSSYKAALSPDGRTLAYSPSGEAFRQMEELSRRYAEPPVADEHERFFGEGAPKPAGGSNDTDPLWIGEALYFSSDRNGEFNLFRYDAGGAVTQLTELSDFPITDPSADGEGTIVFEHAGYLHRFDTRSNTLRPIRIAAISDLIERGRASRAIRSGSAKQRLHST